MGEYNDRFAGCVGDEMNEELRHEGKEDKSEVGDETSGGAWRCGNIMVSMFFVVLSRKFSFNSSKCKKSL
jgi:hypothetical protein